MGLYPPLAILFLGAVFFGPMAYRMVTPSPPGDLEAIGRFLKNRDEELLRARKLWIGGPGNWMLTGVYGPSGRPYRVLARSADGSNWTHDLATDGWDSLGNPMLKQRLQNVWSPVIQ